MAVAIMGKTIRLDKYLTEMNKGSRSQIKEAAKKGRIQVNGQTEKKTDRKIDPQARNTKPLPFIILMQNNPCLNDSLLTIKHIPDFCRQSKNAGGSFHLHKKCSSAHYRAETRLR